MQNSGFSYIDKGSHTGQKGQCYHCGEPLPAIPAMVADRQFCCAGCRTVYQILNESGLCQYYEYTEAPGISQQQNKPGQQFAFLDEPAVAASLLQYEQGSMAQVCLHLPQMHCSSCLWLLEHLQRLDAGIKNSRVDFDKKQVTVLYDKEITSLRKIAQTLTRVGYEPHISLSDIGEGRQPRKRSYSRLYRLGIAGFCFGNIMMLSFPEYLGLGNMVADAAIGFALRYVVLLLALPVFFYSASEFFVTGWKGLRHGFLNIDAPIALAILITFVRSVVEITGGTGQGYLDSMSGIVFFMLAGRVLQDRTRQSLSFTRDYTSYFPVAVSRLVNGKEQAATLPMLMPGDTVVIHSQEIIPADGILVRGQAAIDYSFVTGESLPVAKGMGELCYAGGRQTAGNIELLLVKAVNQSQLTSLWNRESMRGDNGNEDQSIHTISKYFTLLLLAIATTAGIWWALHDPTKVWATVTAVLIVACPCTLLLSSSFTNSHIISLFDKAGLYVRNAAVVERLCRISHIVFDKTGTLTNVKSYTVIRHGGPLGLSQQQAIASLAAQSQHPLSRAISNWLGILPLRLDAVKELPGKGTEAWHNDMHLRLGSPAFVWGQNRVVKATGSVVAYQIDHDVAGYFEVRQNYRSGITELFRRLYKKYSLSVVSGDNDTSRQQLQWTAGPSTHLLFNQQPTDKLAYIEALQAKDIDTMMVGDGLNDAGALNRSLVGVAVAEDINNFSPACDAVLSAAQLPWLDKYIGLAKKAKKIVYASFGISLLYNVVGISLAVQGLLSPVAAAILMPASSISIISFTWLAVKLAGRKLPPLGGT